MSASNDFETLLLDYLYNSAAITGLGATLYIALHTADPGEDGNQETNEATYTSYARVPVTRAGGGWSISGDTASNVAEIVFPAATGGSEVITHFSVGMDPTGPGTVLFYGAVDQALAVSAGVAPKFPAGQLTTTAD